MPIVEMMACPHCGAMNSRRKSVCFQCRNRLTDANATPTVLSRLSELQQLRPAAASPVTTAKVALDAPQQSRGHKVRMLLSVTLRQRAQMYRQMYSLLHSGIPLGMALHHSSESCSFQLRPILKILSDHVSAGGQLSDILTEFPTVFPDWEVNVIRAAEKSGTLPEAMTSISDTIEMEWDLRSRIFSSTIYLQATSLVAILVVLIVRNVGTVTTGDTNDVLSAIIKAGLEFGVVLACIVAIFFGWRYFARTRVGAILVARILPRIPLIGGVLQGLGRIRFVRVLSALWKAGVSPTESLEIAAKTTGNHYFIRQIQQSTSLVMQGSTLASVLAPTKFLPQETIYMLQTGETTGSVAESLEKVGEYFNVDLQAQIKTLPTKLMLIFYCMVVPIVGYILIKFWTKYYSGMGE